jgi:hypothetical protein
MNGSVGQEKEETAGKIYKHAFIIKLYENEFSNESGQFFGTTDEVVGNMVKIWNFRDGMEGYTGMLSVIR